MSKWRYEVEKKNCGYFDRPKYAVYSVESLEMFFGCLYVNEKHKAKHCVEFWRKYASDMPRRTVFDKRYGGYVLAGHFGNGKGFPEISIEEMFPAKRIGRMFPRHKHQIVYK